MGEHDLLFEGRLKLTGPDGVVLDFPLQIPLRRALSPGFIPLAQQQFRQVVDELLVQPATVAFIEHVESIQLERKERTEQLQRTKAAANAQKPPAISNILPGGTPTSGRN